MPYGAPADSDHDAAAAGLTKLASESDSDSPICRTACQNSQLQSQKLTERISKLLTLFESSGWTVLIAGRQPHAHRYVRAPNHQERIHHCLEMKIAVKVGIWWGLFSELPGTRSTNWLRFHAVPADSKLCGVGINFIEDRNRALHVKSLVKGGPADLSGQIQVRRFRIGLA